MRISDWSSDVCSSDLASVDAQISLLKSIGLNAFVCLPLLVGERLVGTFGFGRRWTDHFGEEDIGFLKTVAAYAAIAKDRLQGEAALRISEKRLQESEERLRLAIQVAGLGAADTALTARSEARRVGKECVSPC